MKKLQKSALLWATKRDNRKLFVLLALALTQISCVGVPLLHGIYVRNNVVETIKNYDEVWDDVIDFFANAGIPISTLEKESGLIVAQGITFGSEQITKESKTNYEPLSKSAYIVIPNKFLFGDVSATADFNVRVRNQADKVVITINLLNINANYLIVNPMTLRSTKTEVPAKSTGVFERELLSLFK